MEKGQKMDKVISTVIMASVTVALAITIACYYSSLVGIFTRREMLAFDHAYAMNENGKVEIVIQFRNVGEGKLTVVALEVNGVELESKGKNPFPIELPSGTNARLRLTAGTDTFVSGVTYEVAIRTASGGKYVKAVVIP
jgi:hypothetical protein